MKTKLIAGDGEWDLLLAVSPVPAARPKVSRWGVYYPKTYATFKKEAQQELLKLTRGRSKPETYDGTVVAHMTVVVPKPPTSKRTHPRGDFDNFAKAICDAITECGLIWHDDDQVLCGPVNKRFARPGEGGGWKVKVYAVPDDREPADVYDLPPEFRIPFNPTMP